jgi:putative oxidoreductase
MDRLATTALPALGRLLMSVIFIMAGLEKLGAPEGTIRYIAAHGLPLPSLAYAVSVLVELGGGIAILVGFLTRPVALAMAAFCVVTGVMFHFIPADQNMMIHFMKNIAMAGGFLQLVAWGAGAWSLDALVSARRAAALPALS